MAAQHEDDSQHDLTPREFWHLLRRILYYTKPYKFRLIVGMLCGALMAGSLFSSFIFMVSIFQDLLPSQVDERVLIMEKIEAISRDSSLAQADKEAQLAELMLRKNEKDPIVAKVESFKSAASAIGWEPDVRYDPETKTIHAFDDAVVFQAEVNGKMAWPFLAVSILGLVVAFALKNLFAYTNAYYVQWVGTRMILEMRNEIFKKFTNQSLQYYGKGDVGTMISRSLSDVSSIEVTVKVVATDAIRTPLELIACIAGIVYASIATGIYALPVILFLGVPLCIAPIYLLGRRMKKIFVKALNQIGMITSRMHEVFTGITLVKASHTEAEELERFSEINQEYTRSILRSCRTGLMLSPLMEAVAVAASLAFLLFSYSQGVGLGNLAALMTPAFLAYQPFKKISGIYPTLMNSLAGAQRYFRVIDTPMELPDPVNPKHLESFEHEVVFDHVFFAYDAGEQNTVDDLSFTMKKGQVIAVVGETGSGKSTIANLLARFYDVTAGKVTIDGIDVREIDVADLRRLIGVVTQVPILFNTTIAENIAYGVKNATQAEIEAAAKQANAHHFIVDGPHREQYETVVGEKGHVLSGGEKQRIAIARAILRNPPILILDEATSALDTVTEKLVQDAINKAMKNRTVFAIAHRLSTIQHADLIMVLDHGKVVEQGTHESLYARNGRYRKLCDIQFSANC